MLKDIFLRPYDIYDATCSYNQLDVARYFTGKLVLFIIEANNMENKIIFDSYKVACIVIVLMRS